MKKHTITKEGVLAFIGLLLSTLCTTLFQRAMAKRDMRDTVQAILTEERKQIAEEEAANEET